MASILRDWLNKEIVLSNHIEIFERDLSSGYYVAELLYKLGYYPNFAESFSMESKDVKSPGEKIRNYEKLINPLENMGISIPKKLIREIALESKGAVAKLVLKIKSTNEGREVKSIPRKETHGSHRESSTSVDPEIVFYNTIKKIPTSKEKVVHKILKPFEETKVRNERLYDERRMLEEEEKINRRKDVRVESIDTMTEKRDFDKEWLETGKVNHKRNQNDKYKRERKQLSYELSVVEKLRRSVDSNRYKEKELFAEDVESLEVRLKRLGISTTGDEDADKQKVIPSSKGNAIQHLRKLQGMVVMDKVGDEQYLKHLHEKAKEQNKISRDRQAKQRLMNINQLKATDDSNKKRSFDNLIASIQVENRALRLEAEAMWLDKINESKKERDEQDTAQKTIKERQVDFQAVRNIDALKFEKIRSEKKLIVDTQAIARKEMKRKEDSSFVSSVVYSLLDVCIFVLDYKEDNKMLLSDKEWRSVKRKFCQGSSIFILSPQQEKEISIANEKTVQLLDEADMLDYTCTSSPSAAASTWTPSTPSTTLSTPSFLSIVMETCVDISAPWPPPTPLPISSIPLFLCLRGKPLVGKSSQANLVAKKYRLRILSPFLVIKDALQFIGNKDSTSDQFMFKSIYASLAGVSERGKPDTFGDYIFPPWTADYAKMLESVFAAFNKAVEDVGKEVSESAQRLAMGWEKTSNSAIVAQAICHQIRTINSLPSKTTGGYVVDGFPRTLEQARILAWNEGGAIRNTLPETATFEDWVVLLNKNKWKAPANGGTNLDGSPKPLSAITIIDIISPLPASTPSDLFFSNASGENSSNSSGNILYPLDMKNKIIKESEDGLKEWFSICGNFYSTQGLNEKELTDNLNQIYTSSFTDKKKAIDPSVLTAQLATTDTEEEFVSVSALLARNYRRENRNNSEEMIDSGVKSFKEIHTSTKVSIDKYNAFICNSFRDMRDLLCDIDTYINEINKELLLALHQPENQEAMIALFENVIEDKEAKNKENMLCNLSNTLWDVTSNRVKEIKKHFQPKFVKSKTFDDRMNTIFNNLLVCEVSNFKSSAIILQNFFSTLFPNKTYKDMNISSVCDDIILLINEKSQNGGEGSFAFESKVIFELEKILEKLSSESNAEENKSNNSYSFQDCMMLECKKIIDRLHYIMKKENEMNINIENKFNQFNKNYNSWIKEWLSSSDSYIKNVVDLLHVCLITGKTYKAEGGVLSKISKPQIINSSLANERFQLSIQNLITMAISLKSAASGKSVLSSSIFIDTIEKLASSGSIASSWKYLSKRQLIMLSEKIDVHKSDKIDWRNFIHSLAVKLFGKYPTALQILSAAKLLIIRDNVKDSIEIANNNYKIRELWFDREGGELNQDFRKLYEILWSKPSGTINFSGLLLSWCATPPPYVGFMEPSGPLRATGLSRAFRIMAAINNLSKENDYITASTLSIQTNTAATNNNNTTDGVSLEALSEILKVPMQSGFYCDPSLVFTKLNKGRNEKITFRDFASLSIVETWLEKKIYITFDIYSILYE